MPALARLAGLAGVAVALVTFGWLTTTAQFALDEDKLTISGLVHTDAGLVRQQIGLPAGSRPNVFRLNTGAMEQALLELPAVAEADVTAILPDSLVVEVTERLPVLAWRSAGGDFLVDAEGVLIVAAAPPLPTSLPVIDDRRPVSEPRAAGDRLDPVDLAAALRLGAITPALVGSGADSLSLAVERDEGFVLTAAPEGWRAVFGHYTPNLRTPALIDAQVQCLRSLLAQGETEIGAIYLAAADDRCGTYLPRETPRAEPSPADDG